MDSQDKQQNGGLTLVEAVEALSNIAEMEWDHSLGITHDHDISIQGEKINYRTVHWLHRHNAEENIELVKDVFKVVLNYLKHFYKYDYSLVTDSKTLDGIKTIMVLVGEAAKKIDKYTKLFHEKHPQSVTDLKEYKQLQEFYLRKISRTIDEGVLGRWILALSQKTWKEKKVKLVGRKVPEIKHVFVDLESVKKDTEYELFLIRKEDGTRFFSPRLIRNIKLVCDFGKYFGKEKEKEKDPFVDLAIWRDREAEKNSKWILEANALELTEFYKEAYSLKSQELVGIMNKSVMALMLASNPHHLMSNSSAKNCSEYFKDFQTYLREALTAKDYKKLLAYPPKKHQGPDQAILNLAHGLCRGIFTSGCILKDCKGLIAYLLEEGCRLHSKEHNLEAKKSGSIWSKMASDQNGLQKILHHHPHGPLDILLQGIEDGSYAFFDPYFQGNMPCSLYSLMDGERKIGNLRIPSPTRQEFIQNAEVIPEFKGYLRGLRKNAKHLLINFQDRTSWREHARAQSIEELSQLPEFSKQLVVATLPKDTEFYHQLAPYHEDHQAEKFISHLKEHFKDELSGYYMSKEVQKAITLQWLDGIIEATHKTFFSKKNVLSREARLDFIEIIDLFIILKLIEVIKPDFISFSCKDGVDTGMAENVLLFCFLKIIAGKELLEEDFEQINLMLFGPSLIYRKRSIIPERFHRLINVIKAIESVKNEVGAKNIAKTIQDAYAQYFAKGTLNLTPAISN